VKAIVKHAKLDERQLTQLTQALYFPKDWRRIFRTRTDHTVQDIDLPEKEIK